jgi:hypothetical protein
MRPMPAAGIVISLPRGGNHLADRMVFSQELLSALGDFAGEFASIKQGLQGAFYTKLIIGVKDYRRLVLDNQIINSAFARSDGSPNTHRLHQ